MNSKILINWHTHSLLSLHENITLIIKKHILFITPTIINSFYSYNNLMELYFKYISLKLGYDVSNVIRLQDKLKKEELLELMCSNTIRKALLPFYRNNLYDDLINKLGEPINLRNEFLVRYKVGDFIISYNKKFIDVNYLLKDYIENNCFNLKLFKITKILNKSYKVSKYYIKNYIYKSKIDDFRYKKCFKNRCYYDITKQDFVYKNYKRYNINDLEFILDYNKSIIYDNISIPVINNMNNLLNVTSINFKLNLI